MCPTTTGSTPTFVCKAKNYRSKGTAPAFFGKKRLYGSIPPSLRCFIHFRLQTGGSIPIPLDGWHSGNCRADPADGTGGQYTAPGRR